MKLKIVLIAVIIVLIMSNLWLHSVWRMYDHRIFMLEGFWPTLAEVAHTNEADIEKLERAHHKHLVEQHGALEATPMKPVPHTTSP